MIYYFLGRIGDESNVSFDLLHDSCQKNRRKEETPFFFLFFFGLWNFFLNEIIIFHHAFTFISLSNDAKRQAQN